MRISRFFTGWLAALALCTGALLPAPSQAAPAGLIDTIKQGMQLPASKPWKSGQQATHKLTWDMGKSGDVTMDVRMAITGQEGADYWYEWNFTNLGGKLGKQFAPSFGGLTLRFLTDQPDEAAIKKALDGVKSKSPDTIAAPIRKLQFQMAGQPLYEVEFGSLLKQGTEMAGAMTGTSEGIPDLKEPSGDFSFKVGKENVTVPAGTFNDSMFWQAGFTDTTMNGDLRVNLHEAIPLLPVARVVANYAGKETGTGQVKLELLSHAENGAQTQTSGQPVKKTAEEFLGDLLMLVFASGLTLE